MILDNFKTVVDIINGIVAILAIFAAGLWFLFNRSLAGTLQITLTLVGVTAVNNTQIAIVRVQIKNVGRTRIKKDYCAFATKEINVQSNSEPMNIIEAGLIDYSLGHNIFRFLVEIEPNEETFEDIAVALNKVTFFAAGVELKRKGMSTAWQAIAFFNADDKALVSPAPDLSTKINKPGIDSSKSSAASQ